MKRLFVFITLVLLSLSLSLCTAQKPPAINATPQWQAAAQLAKAGKTAEALEGFRKTLEKCQDKALYLQAANALRQAQGIREAEEIYVYGRKQLKDRAAFAWELADLMLTETRYNEAIAELARAYAGQPDPVRNKLDEVSQVAEYAVVARTFEKSWDRKTESGWTMLAALYLKDNDYKRARGCFERIETKDALKAALKPFLMDPGFPPGELAGMIDDYCQKTGDQDLNLRFLLAGSYARSGNADQAEKLLRSLIATDKPRAVTSFAALMLEAGRPGQALEVLRQNPVNRAWPDSFRLAGLFIKAQCFLALGPADSALALYQPLAEDSTRPVPLRQQAFFEWAEARLMLGDADGSLDLYKRLVKLGASGEEVNDALARIILISETKADKMEGLSLWCTARLEQRRFNFPQAAALFDKVIESCPRSVLSDQAWWGLHELRLSEKNYPRAVEALASLASTSQDTALAAQALYQEGMVYKQQMSQPDKARACWQDGILKYPDTSWADLMREELSKLAQPKKKN